MIHSAYITLRDRGLFVLLNAISWLLIANFKKYILRKKYIEKDIYTYQIISKTTTESDELYRQTLSDDFEHELTYNDIDGTEIKMRLKAVDPEEWSQS